MLEWIKNSADWLAVTVGGLIAAGLVARWVVKRVRAFASKWDNAREVLVGREEIRHPDTGRVLVPATPGLGKRIATMEDTLVALGNTRSEMQDLTTKVGELTTAFEQHINESTVSEQARTKEREAMWHAIEAVATPAPWDGNERRSNG